MGKMRTFTIQVPMSDLEDAVDAVGMFSTLEPSAVPWFGPDGDLVVEFRGEEIET